MNEEDTNSKKGAIEPNSSLLGVPKEVIDTIVEYKLQGKSDRAVGKKVGLAHSTVNKHFHKYLEEQQATSIKNLEQTRFQQWLRFDSVIDIVFQQFDKADFKQVDWAKILTNLLREQSKLYGLNTGNININLDQRTLSGKTINGMPIEEVEEQIIAQYGKTPAEINADRITKYVEGAVESYLCLLLFGTPTTESEAETQVLKDIINIYPTRL